MITAEEARSILHRQSLELATVETIIKEALECGQSYCKIYELSQEAILILRTLGYIIVFERFPDDSWYEIHW